MMCTIVRAVKAAELDPSHAGSVLLMLKLLLIEGKVQPMFLLLCVRVVYVCLLMSM
jgi:hypothetical protein